MYEPTPNAPNHTPPDSPWERRKAGADRRLSIKNAHGAFQRHHGVETTGQASKCGQLRRIFTPPPPCTHRPIKNRTPVSVPKRPSWLERTVPIEKSKIRCKTTKLCNLECTNFVEFCHPPRTHRPIKNRTPVSVPERLSWLERTVPIEKSKIR